jgi:shikimate dehydrogenase
MKVFCILGDQRAALSKSPLMFGTVMQRAGLRGAYVPFVVRHTDLGRAIESLKILNIAGANVTVPYKEAALPHLDQLSEGANIIGAINTIVRSGSQLKGYNTNAVGFMDALSHAGFETAGRRALVFGTGGAAKAMVFILNWLQADAVLVAGRNPDRAAAIVARFGGRSMGLEHLAEAPLEADLLVNATSVSAPVDAPELARTLQDLRIGGCRLVMDLNYGALHNMWRDLADRLAVPFMDGLPALAYQARRTFLLWTGLQVPPEEFLQALDASARR